MKKGISRLWADLERNPEDTQAFRQLSQRLQEAEDHAELIRLNQLRAEHVGDLEAALLLLAVAERWAAKLGDREVADRAFEGSLEHAAGLPALREDLRELFWKRGRWKLLARLLTEDALSAPPGDDRGTALLELARFRVVKLDQAGEAADTYLEAFRHARHLRPVCCQEVSELHRAHPESDAVRRALTVLYREEGRYEELYHLLSEQISTLPADHTVERFEIQLELARVASRDLGRWDLAVGHLRGATVAQPERAGEVIATGVELRKLAPKDRGLVEFLAELCLHAQHVEAGLELMNTAAELAPTQKQRALWHLRAGEHLWKALDRHREALEQFEAAAVNDSANIHRAVEAFRHFIDEELDKTAAGQSPPHRVPGNATVPERVELETRLEALLASSGDVRAMAGLRESRLARAGDAAERVALQLELGDLYRDAETKPRKALEYYLKAKEEAVGDVQAQQVLDRLFALVDSGMRLRRVESAIEELATSARRFNDLFRLLSLRLEQAEGGTAMAQVHFQMGCLLRDHLDQPDAALQHLIRAAELSPRKLDYLQHARDALLMQGRWREALLYLEQEIELSRSRTERVTLVLRALELLTGEVGDPAGALRLAFRWLNRDDAERRIGAWVVNAVLTRPDGRENLEALLDQLGEAPERDLDPATVAAGMAALLAVDRDHELDGGRLAIVVALDRCAPVGRKLSNELKKALEREGRYNDLADMFERRAERALDKGAAKRALDELIGLCRGVLEDNERAISAYWQRFECDSLDFDATKEFLSFLGEQQRADDIATLAERVGGQRVPSGQAKGHFLQALAQVQATQLGRPDWAAATYTKLVEVDPTNGDAIAFFRGHYAEAEDAQSLYDLLVWSARNIRESGAKSERLAELGSVAAERLGDAAVARRHWETVLSMREATVEAKRRSARGLASLFKGADQLPRRLRALRLEVSLLVSLEEQSTRLVEAATELEAEDQLKGALTLFDDYLELRPRDAQILERAADTALQIDDAAREALYVRGMIAAQPEKTEYRLRLARILADELGETEEALNELRVILRQDPGDRIALDALEEILSAQGRTGELIDILRQRVEATTDAAPRAALLERMADTAQHVPSFAQTDWGAWALEELQALDPNRPALANRLAAYYQDRGQWTKAVEALENVLHRTSDPKTRAELLLRLGSIYEHELEDLEKAGDAYRRLLTSMPQDLGALQAMVRIAHKRGAAEEVVDLTQRLLSLEPEVDQVKALAEQAVDLALNTLNDTARAIVVLTRMLDLDPFLLDFLEQLEGLYDMTANRKGQVSALDRLAGLAASEEERVDYWMRRARVFEVKLDDLDSACDCYQDILTVQPANRIALGALKRNYTDLERWRDLLGVLQHLAQVEAEPAIRAATYREAANVHETCLDEPDEAIQLHMRARELLVDDKTSLSEIERLAEAHNLWGHYVEVLRQEIDRARSTKELTERLLRCAGVIETRLEDAQGAFELIFERFKNSPRKDERFAALVEVSARNELWESFASAYRLVLERSVDSMTKIIVLHEVAGLLGEHGQGKRAFKLLEEAYEIRPSYQKTKDKLVELATDLELWEELESFYGRQWDEHPSVREKVGLLIARSAVLDGQLGKRELAFEQMVLAFQLDPENREVEASMQKFARELQQWPPVLKLYEIILAQREEQGIRLHLLTELARVYSEEIGDPSMAFDNLSRALHEDPTYPALLPKLRECAVASGRIEDLAQVLEWDAVQRSDGGERLASWAALARLYQGELGDRTRANYAYAQAYTAALEVGREEEVLGALRESLAGASTDDILATLGQWVSIAPSLEQRRVVLQSLATEAANAGRHDAAIEAYRGILADNPRDTDALEGLARMHKATHAWDRVARSLEQASHVATDREQKHRLLCELAAVHRKQRQFEEAISVYEAVLEDFSEYPPPAAELAELYLQIDRPERAMGLLSEVANRLPQQQGARSLVTAARIASVRLGDINGALRFLKRARNLDANNRETLVLMAEFADKADRWQDQVGAYRELAALTEIDQDDQLGIEQALNTTRLLLTQLPESDAIEQLLTTPPKPKALFLAVAATILEVRRLHSDQAIRAWEAAAEADPDWALPDLQLARLAGIGGDLLVAETALRKAIGQLARRGLRDGLSRAWQALGRMIAREGGRDEDAVSAVEAAISTDPANLSAHTDYAEVLRGPGQLPRARAYYDQLLDSNLERKQRQTVLVGFGQVLERLGDKEAAEDALERALRLGELDADVNAAIAGQCFRRGDYDRALVIYRSLAEHLGEESVGGLPDEQLRMRLAVCGEKTGDVELAQEHYNALYSENPRRTDVLLGLARMALERGAVALAELHIGEALDVGLTRADERAEALLVRADAFAARGDVSSTIEVLELAVDVPSVHRIDVLRRLTNWYRDQSRWADAVRALEQLEASLPAGLDRVEALLERAGLCRQYLKEPQQAWQALQEVLVTMPDHLGALEQAVALAVDLKRFSEARGLADRVLKRLKDAKAVARCRLLAGKAAAGEDDLPAARTHYSAAIRLDPFNSDALEGRIDVASRQGEWEGLREDHEAHLREVGDSRPAVRGRILRSLAEVLAGPIRDRKGALRIYSELIEMYPDDVPLLMKQLEMFRNLEPVDGDRAAHTIHRLAELGEVDLDGIRFLQDWYLRSGRADGTYVMTSLLAACGEATGIERRRLRTLPTVEFDCDRFHEAYEKGYFETNLRFHPTLDAVVKALRAAGLSASNDALTSGFGHAFEEELSFLTEAMGTGDIRLRWGTHGEGNVVVASRPPGARVDPEWFDGLTAAEQRFELAALACMMRPEYIMCSVLREFDYIAFHEAALEPILSQEDDGFGRDATIEAKVRDWRLELGRDPDKDPRKSPGAGLDRAMVPSPTVWRASLQQTSWRLGLLFCDDIEAALTQLAKRNPGLAGRRMRSLTNLREAVRISTDIRDLVAWSLSEGYLTLRNLLNLSRRDFSFEADMDASLDGKDLAEFELEIAEESIEGGT